MPATSHTAPTGSQATRRPRARATALSTSRSANEAARTDTVGALNRVSAIPHANHTAANSSGARRRRSRSGPPLSAPGACPIALRSTSSRRLPDTDVPHSSRPYRDEWVGGQARASEAILPLIARGKDAMNGARPYEARSVTTVSRCAVCGKRSIMCTASARYPAASSTRRSAASVAASQETYTIAAGRIRASSPAPSAPQAGARRVQQHQLRAVTFQHPRGEEVERRRPHRLPPAHALAAARRLHQPGRGDLPAFNRNHPAQIAPPARARTDPRRRRDPTPAHRPHIRSGRPWQAQPTSPPGSG